MLLVLAVIAAYVVAVLVLFAFLSKNWLWSNLRAKKAVVKPVTLPVVSHTSNHSMVVKPTVVATNHFTMDYPSHTPSYKPAVTYQPAAVPPAPVKPKAVTTKPEHSYSSNAVVSYTPVDVSPSYSPPDYSSGFGGGDTSSGGSSSSWDSNSSSYDSGSSCSSSSSCGSSSGSSSDW